MSKRCDFCDDADASVVPMHGNALCGACYREMMGDAIIASQRRIYDLRLRVYSNAIQRGDAESYMQEAETLLRAARESFYAAVREYASVKRRLKPS
ncbi:MAG: hypothetical protein GWN29_04850 [Gammaproteobacteria bacterium]|nr:hypothetical protein [Gammaproteobacteria bacterium]NIV51083.1 hypothetical protein [Gammaproteobacteria bacterium]NIW23934.1 hypothetical protein [Gammaproteobacteria bacterium]NIX85026.1 hypothetical protein [Gammaproteobacteria bacterium]